MAEWFGHRQADGVAIKGVAATGSHGQTMSVSAPQRGRRGGSAGSEDASRATFFSTHE